MKKYKILYEDEHVVAVDKPTGLSTVADRYDSNAVHLQSLLRNKYGAIFTIHRIDRDTSGVILFAKNAEAHRQLSMDFEERKVSKTYLAITDSIAPDSGTIDQPIKESIKTPGYMTVNRKGKPALTTYTKIRDLGIGSLLSVDIHTGRTHQIRVHLKHEGFGLFIDPIYGRRTEYFLSELKGRRYKRGKYEEERPLISRLTLHAHKLTFTHPATNKLMTIESPMPKDIKALVHQLEKVYGKDQQD